MKKMKTNFINIIITLSLCASAFSNDKQTPHISFKTKNPEIEKSRELRKQIKYYEADSMIKENIPEPSQKNQTSLDELIQSLNQLHFKEEEQKSIIEPSEESEQKKEQVQKTGKKINDKDKNQLPPEQEINPYEEKINKLLSNPENIENPLPVAEALFKMGYIKKAGFFYKYALENIMQDKENSDRPWVLFQTANSLRTSEPNLSYKYYQMLMDEYPDSFWVSAAKSRQEMLAWYQDTATSQILKKYVTNPKIKKEINAYIDNLQKMTDPDKVSQNENKLKNEQ